jgi:hypothetical protein
MAVVSRAWGVLVAGLVLFGAGFLPWLVIRIHKGAEVWTIPIWGWAGALRPFGVPVLPCALVPVVGLVCALLAVARLAGLFRVSWKVPFGLGLLAFAHASVCLASAGRNSGVGLALSVASALAIAALSWRRKAPAAP